MLRPSFTRVVVTQYVPSGSTNAAICLLVTALAIMLRYVHNRENKKLGKAEAALSEEGAEAETTGGGRVAPGFRYVY